MNDRELEKQAHDLFVKELLDFLTKHPYWLMILSKKKPERKRLARDLTDAITKFPVMREQELRPEGLPNRETRRAIIGEVNKHAKEKAISANTVAAGDSRDNVLGESDSDG